MSLRFTTSGESHGPALVAILEGVPAGLIIKIDQINEELARRQIGKGSSPRMRIEKDQVEVLSGVMEGKSIGSPITMLIRNRNHQDWMGKEIETYHTPRPGHADLAGLAKYGFDDIRPVLERASARETAARVACGAICKNLLQQFEVQVGAYIKSLADIEAQLNETSIEERFQIAKTSEIKNADPNCEKAMLSRIDECIKRKETLGGVIEAGALNLPPGLGSYARWDTRLDARLAAAIMSIPAIKGVEIGEAFKNTTLPGSKAHDTIHRKKGTISRGGNRAGGIEGGMTNGEAVLIRAAMKPIPTTLKPQHTVDLTTGVETSTTYERSDFCPVPRAIPIVEAMLAFVLADALLDKTGGDSMQEIMPRIKVLRQIDLGQIRLENKSRVYWPLSEQRNGNSY